MANELKRFWGKVRKGEGCWEWTACIGTHGYGVFSAFGKPVTTHTFSYRIHHGPIPEDEEVRHTCDNRKCVNPDHLILGTSQDNTDDCVSRDRHKRGERGAWTLSNEKVEEIRNRAAAGAFQKDLAAEFHVNQSTISRLVNKKRWTHL